MLRVVPNYLPLTHTSAHLLALNLSNSSLDLPSADVSRSSRLGLGAWRFPDASSQRPFRKSDFVHCTRRGQSRETPPPPEQPRPPSNRDSLRFALLFSSAPLISKNSIVAN